MSAHSTALSHRSGQGDRFITPANNAGASKDNMEDTIHALQQNDTLPKISYYSWLQTLSHSTAEHADTEQNRLLAVSTVVAATAAENPGLGRYLAGLWTAHLPDALGWTITSPRTHSLSYVAPSWSWASLGGQVRSAPYPSSKVLKLIDAHITLADEAQPYGDVLDGYIIVEGELGRTGHTVEGDLPGSTLPKGTLAVKLSWSDWNLFYALLLKPSERVEGAYERLGIDIIMDHAFYDAKTTVIKLV